MLLLPGLFCAKASLLLLFLQIFDTKSHGKKMKIVIWVGMAANFLIYFPSIPIISYYGAPSPGESWENFTLSLKPEKSLVWGIVQSALVIVLDLYIFIIPIPVTLQLHMPWKTRLQLAAVFSTAFT